MRIDTPTNYPIIEREPVSYGDDTLQVEIAVPKPAGNELGMNFGESLRIMTFIAGVVLRVQLSRIEEIERIHRTLYRFH